MKNILIATRNRNKKSELEKLLKDLNVKVLTLENLKIHIPPIVEDGKTFRQNAVKKALTVSHYVDGIVIADDSGLTVEALGGKPGVRSSRFARAKATYPENNAKLLKLMENVAAKRRQAAFICVVAVARKGHLLGTVEGRCSGTVGFELKGKNGFGYDPLFTPKGYSRTFAQISASSKNRISHRGKALRKTRAILQKYL